MRGRRGLRVAHCSGCRGRHQVALPPHRRARTAPHLAGLGSEEDGRCAIVEPRAEAPSAGTGRGDAVNHSLTLCCDVTDGRLDRPDSDARRLLTGSGCVLPCLCWSVEKLDGAYVSSWRKLLDTPDGPPSCCIAPAIDSSIYAVLNKLSWRSTRRWSNHNEVCSAHSSAKWHADAVREWFRESVNYRTRCPKLGRLDFVLDTPTCSTVRERRRAPELSPCSPVMLSSLAPPLASPCAHGVRGPERQPGDGRRSGQQLACRFWR